MKYLIRWSKDSSLRTGWYNFAVELVGKSSAEVIRATHYRGGNHSCLQRMLVAWYDSTVDHSWQMIMDALEEIEGTEPVKDAIKKECQLSINQQLPCNMHVASYVFMHKQLTQITGHFVPTLMHQSMYQYMYQYSQCILLFYIDSTVQLVIFPRYKFHKWARYS